MKIHNSEVSYNLDFLTQVILFKSRKDVYGIYTSELPEGHFEKNGEYYIKDGVCLQFVNDYKYFYFDSYEEAKKFAEEVKSYTGRWIK